MVFSSLLTSLGWQLNPLHINFSEEQIIFHARRYFKDTLNIFFHIFNFLFCFLWSKKKRSVYNEMSRYIRRFSYYLKWSQPKKSFTKSTVGFSILQILQFPRAFIYAFCLPSGYSLWHAICFFFSRRNQILPKTFNAHDKTETADRWYSNRNCLQLTSCLDEWKNQH